MDYGKLGNCIEGRLYAVRKDQKLSQEEFGAKIGVTRSAICNYENGTRPISEQVILAVCREFGLNEIWMREGVGEPYKPKEDSLIAQLISEYHCTNFEGDFLKTYFQMDAVERLRFVEAMYRLMAPFAKSLEGKNPFSEYYNLPVSSELAFSKAQRDRFDVRISELEERVETIEKEGEIAETKQPEKVGKKSNS